MALAALTGRARTPPLLAAGPAQPVRSRSLRPAAGFPGDPWPTRGSRMALPAPLLSTSFPGLSPVRSGKVRDLYDAGDDLADRRHRPHLGVRLRARLRHPRQGQGAEPAVGVLVRPDDGRRAEPRAVDRPATTSRRAARARGRAARPVDARPPHRTSVPIECVVRGYLVGSGWAEYQQDAARSAASRCPPGCARPTGCRSRSSRRPRRRRPATTSTSSKDEAGRLVGRDLIDELARLSLQVYCDGRGARRNARHHRRRHEVRVRRAWATAARQQILLIDEVLTPDSSRFWPADGYKPGGSQPSFDKQYVRDYLEQIKWNKQPPVPVAARRGGGADAREVRRGADAAGRPRRGRAGLTCASAWNG